MAGPLARQVLLEALQTPAVLEETTAGIRIVKSFAREGYEIGRFSQRVNATFAAATTAVIQIRTIVSKLPILAAGSNCRAVYSPPKSS